MKIQDLNKLREEKLSAILEKYGVFFAFSNEQFLENKTPLKEGEKYVSIGAGGYLPKSNACLFSDEWEALDVWYKKTLKDDKKEAENAILYELNNHECFYTWDYSEVVKLFDGIYTEKQIKSVFNKFAKSYSEL